MHKENREVNLIAEQPLPTQKFVHRQPYHIPEVCLSNTHDALLLLESILTGLRLPSDPRGGK